MRKTISIKLGFLNTVFKYWIRNQICFQAMSIWSHHFMGKRWGNSGNSDRLYFSGHPNH